MASPRECPLYRRGSSACCGRKFEAQVQAKLNLGNSPINASYRNSQTRRMESLVIPNRYDQAGMKYIDTGRSWSVQIPANPQVRSLLRQYNQIPGALTTEVRRALATSSTGVTVQKSSNCPLKR